MNIYHISGSLLRRLWSLYFFFPSQLTWLNEALMLREYSEGVLFFITKTEGDYNVNFPPLFASERKALCATQFSDWRLKDTRCDYCLFEGRWPCYTVGVLDLDCLVGNCNTGGCLAVGIVWFDFAAAVVLVIVLSNVGQTMCVDVHIGRIKGTLFPFGSRGFSRRPSRSHTTLRRYWVYEKVFKRRVVSCTTR